MVAATGRREVTEPRSIDFPGRQTQRRLQKERRRHHHEEGAPYLARQGGSVTDGRVDPPIGQTIEQAVPVGGQLPISDKGRESDPTEDDEPPPPALDDEEKTTCPDCEGGEDMALCGLCGGSGEIPLVDPPAGEKGTLKGTLMVNGKEGLTKEEAKEEAGW